MLVAGPALADRAEELPGREVAVLVEVLEPLFAAETVLAVGELLVALVLESFVPVEDVVGARDVVRVVGTSVLASASHGV